jgi:hypothetical protein
LNNDYPATPFLGPPTQVWWVSYWSMNSSLNPLCELDDKQGVTHVLFSWHLCRFYVAPSPGGLGFGPAAERFLKLIAMVWAGSQVTKVLRGLGALALAPLVDKGLIWFTNHFRFASRGKAFGFLVGIAVLLAIAVFFVITILWA